MDDAGIDGDHEIERRDRGGGLGEVGQVGREVRHPVVRERSEIAGTLAHLQREPLHAGNVQQRRKPPERDRARAVVLVRRVAGPHDTDLHAELVGEARAPARGGFRRGADIGNIRRYGFEPGAERERQAHLGAVRVEGRQRLADDRGRVRAALEVRDQPFERGRHLDHDAAAARRHQRRVAQQHQAIAKALFGVQQDGLAVERLTAPDRLREVARLAARLPPAPFELRQAGGIITVAQQKERLGEVRIHIVRPDLDRAAELDDGLVAPAAALQRLAEIEEALGKVRPERDRATEAVDGLAVTAALRQCRAEIVAGGDQVGRERHRLAGGFLRPGEAAAAAQRARQVAVGLGVVGRELDGALEAADRILMARQRQEGGPEIVVRLRVVGRKLGHAREQVGGRGMVARLVAQDAEQTQGRVVIGYGCDDAARDRFGFVPAAGGAQPYRLGVERARTECVRIEPRRSGRTRRGALRQCDADAGEDVIPIAELALAKQPQRRVPRAVLAFGEPAPVGRERHHHPARPAERAGEMHDRGVDRDHQVEMRQRRRGVGEGLQVRREIDHFAARVRARQADEVGRALADLQRVETRARNVEQRREALDRDRAAAVARMLRIARPRDADLEAAAGARQPLRPALHRGRIRVQIGARRRKCVERHPEHARQTHESAVHVEMPQALALRDDLAAAVEAGGEPHQARRQLEQQPSAARRDLRHEAQALDVVAGALLGMQQDGLAVERLALPGRLREVARRHGLEPPAPLVLGEAVGEVAA
jgi:hypothetical protein